MTLEKSETSAIVGDHIVHIVVSRLVRAHGANILLDAEVENEGEDDDPGEVRQPHHVASLNSFPEREPGVVRQPRHVTSHSSFPGPTYL